MIKTRKKDGTVRHHPFVPRKTVVVAPARIDAANAAGKRSIKSVISCHAQTLATITAQETLLSKHIF